MKKLVGMTVAVLLALSMGFMLGTNTQTATAGEKEEYQVVLEPDYFVTAEQYNKFISEYVNKGWKLHIWKDKVMVFKK